MTIFPYNDTMLENLARSIIIKYDPALLREPTPIPVEEIMEKVYGLTIEFQYIRKNGRILGETVFEDAMVPIYDKRSGEGYKLVPVKAGTVLIDVSLMNKRGDGRYNWTCAHELAHWVEHREYYKQLGETAAMVDIKRSSEANKTVERQANRLTNYFLMPKGTVKMAFFRNHGARNITAALAEIFHVSREAMDYRLQEMGLL